MERIVDYTIKITLLGDNKTGKSCLMKSYAGKGFCEGYNSTIGINFKQKMIDFEGKMISLQLWDSTGLLRFKLMAHTFYRGSHVCAILIDLTNRSTLDNIRNYVKEIEYQLPETKILLMGNKVDLINNRMINYDEVKRLSDELGIMYIEISVKMNYNVNQAFKILLRNIFNEIRNSKIIYHPVVTPSKYDMKMRKRYDKWLIT